MGLPFLAETSIASSTATPLMASSAGTTKFFFASTASAKASSSQPDGKAGAPLEEADRLWVAKGFTLLEDAVTLLDQFLFILILVEVLYTIQVAFREHALVPEPFLIVGLIPVVRRVLVLTAELQQLLQTDLTLFQYALGELGLMTALIVALVASLLMLRRRAPSAGADRA